MPIYITSEGMQRLQQHLSYLHEERPKVVAQVQKARELGDLSENAEYHAARERQRQIDSELDHINRRMANVQVIDSSTLPKDAIRFGAWITLEDCDQDAHICYRLVGADEVSFTWDDGYERISIESPIGKAMIGRKLHENFKVKVPSGVRTFTVLEIK